MGSSDRTESLKALLPRCQGGDREAYVEVYGIMGKPLFGTALRIMKRPEEAEEVVQEAFIKLFEKARTIQGSLGSWLHRVTVNLCLDRMRLKANQTEELPAEIPVATTGQGGVARLDLGRAVEKLPERARLVFLLHDVEGYKHREVGELLGITDGTSKAQLFRAREMLRRNLDGPTEATA